MLVLVGLFAVAVALAFGPLEAGAVRLGGVSLLWWYATVAAPLAAVAVVVATTRPDR
jgi:hypothetical protein